MSSPTVTRFISLRTLWHSCHKEGSLLKGQQPSNPGAFVHVYAGLALLMAIMLIKDTNL